MINDADMALLCDKLKSSNLLKVLFLCSISVSAEPLSSVILRLHLLILSSVSDVLIISAPAMYCSPWIPSCSQCLSYVRSPYSSDLIVPYVHVKVTSYFTVRIQAPAKTLHEDLYASIT